MQMDEVVNGIMSLWYEYCEIFSIPQPSISLDQATMFVVAVCAVLTDSKTSPKDITAQVDELIDKYKGGN